MQLKVHTKGIVGSREIKKGEEAAALFAGLLELDGEIYDRVNEITVNFGEDFATVNVTFIPGDVEIVTHTAESWSKICKEADDREQQRAEIRNSEGRMIAIYVSGQKED